MSIWTHIRGGFELSSSPLEKKRNKIYLPKPQEQAHLGIPNIYYDDKKKRYVAIYPFYLKSLPRAKPHIDYAFTLLPYGESGWHYAISQSLSNHDSSSGDFEYPCEKEAFENKIAELYNQRNETDFDFKLITELYLDIELQSIIFVDGIVVGVREDIRGCSSEQMLKSLQKFFLYLQQNDIYVKDGYLEWEDDLDQYYFYCWRKTGRDEEAKFYKLKRKNNEIEVEIKNVVNE